MTFSARKRKASGTGSSAATGPSWRGIELLSFESRFGPLR